MLLSLLGPPTASQTPPPYSKVHMIRVMQNTSENHANLPASFCGQARQ